MFRKHSLYAPFALLAIALASCNSAQEEATVSAYESTVIDGFSLQKNDELLANLDSVFFSIDLNTAQIYNADSLPKGTDVSKLTVKISTGTVKGVTLTVNRGEKGDTVYNYITSQNDSIDFTQPVTMRVTSLSGASRDYQIKVNVHKSDPDLLMWSRTERTELPGASAQVAAQKTVEFKGEAVTFVKLADGSAKVSVTANPSEGWETMTASLPAGADVRSLTASDNALYILDSAGALYTASEAGGAWTSTGVKASSLLGGYRGSVMLVANASGKYRLEAYPALDGFNPADAPADFPVSGCSNMLCYSSEWTPEVTAVIAGGLDRDGIPVPAAWAFDGGRWAKISDGSLPAASGISIVPYFAFKTNDNWTVSRETVVLAFGGLLADGSLNRSVYISWDRGINWRRASNSMALPEYIPDFAFADALVFSSVLSARGGSDWAAFPSAPLPRWWTVQPASRAVSAPSEWDCPFIYLFGGEDADAATYNTVWRGVVNRLTFKPLY